MKINTEMNEKKGDGKWGLLEADSVIVRVEHVILSRGTLALRRCTVLRR